MYTIFAPPHAAIVRSQQAPPIEAFGIDMKVLLSTEATRGSISVLMAWLKPCEGPRAHVHHDRDEVFFLLEGLYELTIDGQTATAGPGILVFIPRNVVHSFQNVGDTVGCVLDWTMPGGQDHYFKAISELAADGCFTSEKAIKISRKFDTNFPASH